MWHAGWLLTSCSLITQVRSALVLINTPSASDPSRAIRIGSTAMQPVSAVRDLGIMLDAEVTMSTHVSAVVRASFVALRRVRSVRRSIPRRALLTLIQALVVSKGLL